MQYDHHPDPAIAFCIEVDALEGMAYDVMAGLCSYESFIERCRRASEFRVGGDPHAVAAKDRLRALIATVRPQRN